MENIKDIGRLIRYIYYLDEEDYLYMSQTLTRTFNWIIPAVAGGWMGKRLYLISNPQVVTKVRIPLALLPLACPALSCYTMYLIYYRKDDHIQELIQKYPESTNFRARKKINPFKVGRNK